MEAAVTLCAAGHAVGPVTPVWSICLRTPPRRQRVGREVAALQDPVDARDAPDGFMQRMRKER